jgi:hypothetical protein
MKLFIKGKFQDYLDYPLEYVNLPGKPRVLRKAD